MSKTSGFLKAEHSGTTVSGKAIYSIHEVKNSAGIIANLKSFLGIGNRRTRARDLFLNIVKRDLPYIDHAGQQNLAMQWQKGSDKAGQPAHARACALHIVGHGTETRKPSESDGDKARASSVSSEHIQWSGQDQATQNSSTPDKSTKSEQRADKDSSSVTLDEHDEDLAFGCLSVVGHVIGAAIMAFVNGLGDGH
ncbi:MAG: hypothetical protein AAF830_11775 [Pseudomonadota bacterium]